MQQMYRTSVDLSKERLLEDAPLSLRFACPPGGGFTASVRVAAPIPRGSRYPLVEEREQNRRRLDLPGGDVLMGEALAEALRRVVH